MLSHSQTQNNPNFPISRTSVALLNGVCGDNGKHVFVADKDDYYEIGDKVSTILGAMQITKLINDQQI